MYTFTTPLTSVRGIGPTIAHELAERGILTIKDLLLCIPLRYEDRSLMVTIDQLQLDQLVTIQATVQSTRNFYKGRRSIQSAQVSDATGTLKLMWFNNRFVMDKLKKGESYLFSGKVNQYHTMTQPVVEDVKVDTIHTNRLVPIYSSLPTTKAGTFRRILKQVIDQLSPIPDQLSDKNQLMTLTDAIHQLHFPDTDDMVIQARERMALEELLCLMSYSHQVKEQWRSLPPGILIPTKEKLSNAIPFELTGAQQRVIKDILTDLNSTEPMNRLLIGDVGSGKTVVAGIAAQQIIAHGHSVALIAPTQILAEQHMATIAKLFPNLPLVEVTAKNSKKFKPQTTPAFYIGTHAVINRLAEIKPALIVYDEQHRFGVMQRSSSVDSRAHILTMTATPIPRSLMLTIFSHLHLSVIDEMPAGRQPVKTWLVPNTKQHEAYQWLAQQLLAELGQGLAFLVCPFINPSESKALENVAAVEEKFHSITQQLSAFPNLRIALLHGRLSAKEKEEVTKRLFANEIDLLVTTPIIEVGMDLPMASMIVIEGAERFGLASLHQLRGRVGRAGQQGYCLLFTTDQKQQRSPRLKQFCQLHDGLKLAEIDLQHRGAGDIFGIQQHGFDQLRFADWTNVSLITQARQIFEDIQKKEIAWEPFLEITAKSDSVSAN